MKLIAKLGNTSLVSDSESEPEASLSSDMFAMRAMFTLSSFDSESASDVSEESEASGSDSESDTEEVFYDFTVNFSKAELAESLSEIMERYQQIRFKFKNLKKDLASDSEETESLRLENQWYDW